MGFLSAMGEGLRVGRSHLSRSLPLSSCPATVTAPDVEEPEDGRGGRLATASSVQKLMDDAREGGGTHWDTRPAYHLFLSLVHTFHMTVGYILMLTVMTFNTYIFITILIGVGLGYFLFAPFDAMLSSKRNPYLSPLVEGGLSRVVQVRKKCPIPTCENVSSAVEGEEHCSHSGSSEECSHRAGSSAISQPRVARSCAPHDGVKDSHNDCESSDSLVDEGDAPLLLTETTTSRGGDGEEDAYDSDSNEHRTSDIAGLLSGQLTVDVHVTPHV